MLNSRGRFHSRWPILCSRLHFRSQQIHQSRDQTGVSLSLHPLTYSLLTLLKDRRLLSRCTESPALSQTKWEVPWRPSTDTLASQSGSIPLEAEADLELFTQNPTTVKTRLFLRSRRAQITSTRSWGRESIDIDDCEFSLSFFGNRILTSTQCTSVEIHQRAEFQQCIHAFWLYFCQSEGETCFTMIITEMQLTEPELVPIRRLYAVRRVPWARQEEYSFHKNHRLLPSTNLFIYDSPCFKVHQRQRATSRAVRRRGQHTLCDPHQSKPAHPQKYPMAIIPLLTGKKGPSHQRKPRRDKLPNLISHSRGLQETSPGKHTTNHILPYPLLTQLRNSWPSGQ